MQMMRIAMFYALLATGSAYAVRRGGPSERAAAAIIVADVMLTLLVRRAGADRYERFQPGVFCADAGAFVLLLGIALTSKRWWPLWMSGLALATVISHIVRLSPTVNGFTYYTLIVIWIYPMLLLLMVATWRHGRRISAASSAP